MATTTRATDEFAEANHDDITRLPRLELEDVIRALRARFERGQIYTRAGPCLVAVNPYEDVAGLYDPDVASRYAAEAEAEASTTSFRRPRQDHHLRRQPLPPHIFETASKAYSNMVFTGKSQSIVISGESGAGKTESAKLALRQVAALASAAASASAAPFASRSSPSSPEKEAGRFAALESAILASNPILEAFGNARTLRNDNSSRFGKFVELLYKRSVRVVGGRGGGFSISGVRISTCLLERSRLVSRPQGERNFHVLYQLAAGADDGLREELRLPPRPSGTSSFRYLCSTTVAIEGVDDAAEFSRVEDALETVGIERGEQQRSVWRALAAVLHLGNIDFAATDDGESCEVAVAPSGARPDSLRSSSEALEAASSLLGVPPAELSRMLTTREITAGGGAGGKRRDVGAGGAESVVKPLRRDEAASSRDALSKAIYSRLFDWLVFRINEALAPEKDKAKKKEREEEEAKKENKKDGDVGDEDEGDDRAGDVAISLLDLFGFEVLDDGRGEGDGANGFEQLLINFANEHLQSKFNSELLLVEQEAHEDEGIDFSRVEWRDNAAVVSALDARPASFSSPRSPAPSPYSVGLLALLDEACVVPGGTDAGFGLRISEVLAPSAPETQSSSEASSSFRRASSSAPSASQAVIKGCPAGAGSSFTVAHAAGSVVYRTAGMIAKNKDVVSSEALAFLSKESSDPLIRELSAAQYPRAKAAASPSQATTVASAFRSQLRSLLSTLEASQLHFVRCVKPNSLARPSCFDEEMVAHQLRCAGVAEVARVARQGFPCRVSHGEFCSRFHALVAPDELRGEERGDGAPSVSSACLSVLSSPVFGLDPKIDYAVGRTKVFLRSGVLAHLERELQRRSSAATTIAARFKGERARRELLRKRRAAVVIQASARARAARNLLLLLLEATKREEEDARRRIAAEEEQARAAAAAAVAAMVPLPSPPSAYEAASGVRGAERIAEAAACHAEAGAKRAASAGDVPAPPSRDAVTRGRWKLPRVPDALRNRLSTRSGAGSDGSSEGAVGSGDGNARVRRPPAAAASSVAGVALWATYSDRLETQVVELLRTNRALRGSLAAARADAGAAFADASAADVAAPSLWKKKVFACCAAPSRSSPPHPPNGSSSPAQHHASALRELDALRDALGKRQALFEDDASFLEEVATGSTDASPGFHLLGETKRLRKRFEAFVSSFEKRLEGAETVVLGAVEAANESEARDATDASGGRGATSPAAPAAAARSKGEAISSPSRLVASLEATAR